MGDEIDIVVTRREPPPALPPFECAACQRQVEPPPWPVYRTAETPPICGYCARHWGKGHDVTGATRGDRRVMQRLTALCSLIDWEVRNARFRP